MFLVKWSLVAGLWALLAITGVIAWHAWDLPDTRGIAEFNRRPGLTFVAADGQTIGAYGDIYGGLVELDEMPRWLPQAVLATEDRRFYSHFGLDPIGLLRAAYVNLLTGRIVQGGSTITQQLAKNVFLTHERTVGRKIQETILALWLEHNFSKDQILTIYLNRVYLGAGTYGVEAAARRYFGKSARHLGRYEAAVIAGLLKAPSRFAPTADLARARARGLEVLDRMVDAGYMSQQDAATARREPIRLAGGATAQGARYFTDWLVDQVPSFVGFVQRDLVIVTTLDPHLQQVAEKVVEQALAKDGAKGDISQAALVAMTPTGAVKAMVGGRDYGESQYNRAAVARRQPGSTFKPFVFLAGIEAGLTPDDRVSDAPITIGRWSPRNFDDTQRGEITLREALARSVNTATVRVAQQAGIDRLIATARRMGLNGELRRDFATALGASETSLIELTSAFAPFANGGNGVLPYAIAEIKDSNGRVLYRRAGTGPGQVVQPGPLADMTDMLTAVVQRGTGRAAQLDRPVGGKTGTSQDFRDAWFVGYTADYIAGVWMGNDDGAPMDRITGGSLPARTWRTFMTEAHKGLPVRDFAATPVAAGGFDFNRLIDSLFRGDRGPTPPPDLPAPARQRLTPNDPANRPGAPPM
ncbi:MAG TPA: penicillin-binding protein 1A [Alphaproteobacteria bacterium]|nr:penicillin-binding protein 1A [Alphaproteobacteria bacterium]